MTVASVSSRLLSPLVLGLLVLAAGQAAAQSSEGAARGAPSSPPSGRAARAEKAAPSRGSGPSADAARAEKAAPSRDSGPSSDAAPEPDVPPGAWSVSPEGAPVAPATKGSARRRSPGQGSRDAESPSLPPSSEETPEVDGAEASGDEAPRPERRRRRPAASTTWDPGPTDFDEGKPQPLREPEAPERAEPPRPKEPPPPPPDRFWQIQAGGRVSFLKDAGFDPFSRDDLMGQFSLSGSRTLLRSAWFSFAPGVVWEFGWKQADVRGLTSSLRAHRWGIRLEGRAHLLSRLYLLGRVTPGVAYETARLEDPSAPGSFSDSQWSRSLDLSGGAAVLLHGTRSPLGNLFFWFEADGGYGWHNSRPTVLSVELEDGDTRRFGALSLPNRTLSGAFMRFAASVAF